MNTNQYQSLSTEREEIMSIIPDLKPPKFYPVPVSRQCLVKLTSRTQRTSCRGQIGRLNRATYRTLIY
ncbi:unnamed protein product [Macrosiphum euphorbiae]|uniref:Uncharacterized protein n=1 Tax=Macrosiphum euphorbiae TaxID=13131 RepID=A0AAV0X846_9HEMI|nr:unnamed protein product [Macrosiphum euphorbiae]